MIRSGKIDRRVTFYRMAPDTLATTEIAAAWVSIRAKPDEGIAGFQNTPMQTGLRHPVLIEMRMRHRSDLIHGDYAVWKDRLFHLFALRDPNGKQAELIASCHELIGVAATYTAVATGSPAPASLLTRAFVRRDAPYLGQIGQVVDYRTQIELSIFETGRALRGSTVRVNQTTYTVQTLAADDGVVRTVWAT